MLGARDPADAVIRVEDDALVTLFDAEEPETVVVDEYRGCTTLAGVGLHCFLERLDGGCPACSGEQAASNGRLFEDSQDRFEALLVDRHLNGDVREVVVDHLVGAGRVGGVVLRILVVLANGSDAHRHVLHDLECKELGRSIESGTSSPSHRITSKQITQDTQKDRGSSAHNASRM